MSPRCAAAFALLAACTASPERGDRTAGASLSASPPAIATAKVVSSAPAVAARASVEAPSATTLVATPPAPTGPLAHFHQTLHALERGERRDHVRIAWLGDSHGQADFWSGHVRSALQKRFGHGGPGFVHLGMKEYRHDGVRVEVDGSWRMRPKKPSQVETWGDGRFGRGGILHAGFAGQRVASVEVTDGSLAGRTLLWDLCFKPTQAQDLFRLELASSAEETFGGKTHALNALHHLERRSAGPAKLRAVIKDGRPDFCGLTIETDPAEKPGVVLDNLAINGARYATALAWDETGWAEEMKRRPTELWLFEFGGNEASDIPPRTTEYKANLLALVARARRIRPEASCVVLGLAERSDKEANIAPIAAAQREAAAEAGCFFWDTYAAMGGKGAMKVWQSDGRGADDGVHLKPKGYEELGALLVADLMRSY